MQQEDITIIDADGNYYRPASPNLVNVARLVYILHAVSILLGILTGASIAMAFVFGWPSIIAVIINYVKRDDVKGTHLESHFIWQIRTFWYALLWIVLIGVLGAALAFFLVGFAIWLAGFIILGLWVCYRIIKGWLRLSDGQPMQN
jgi:uncharacterized membrane protein